MHLFHRYLCREKLRVTLSYFLASFAFEFLKTSRSCSPSIIIDDSLNFLPPTSSLCHSSGSHVVHTIGLRNHELSPAPSRLSINGVSIAVPIGQPWRDPDTELRASFGSSVRWRRASEHSKNLTGPTADNCQFFQPSQQTDLTLSASAGRPNTSRQAP